LILKNIDKILPEVDEWQDRPPDKIHPVIFFNGIFLLAERQQNNSKMRVFRPWHKYGVKEILGMRILENESANGYASI